MTLDIRSLDVGTLHTNCYLVTDPVSKETVIIDPGDDAPYIADTIAAWSLQPVAVAATHGHFDHILATWEVTASYAIPFFLHPKDRFLLLRMQESAARYVPRPIVEPVPVVTNDAIEGKKILFGTTFLQIMELPGHTPGGIGLVTEDGRACFSGDTLFADGAVGEWRHAYAHKETLDRSVQKILSLSPSCILYPGHGSQTTVESERRYHQQ